MKATHRSEKLDALLNKTVRVTFTDDTTAKGVLFWNTSCKAPLYIRQRGYYLRLSSGSYLSFRKSHVKKIEEL